MKIDQFFIKMSKFVQFLIETDQFLIKIMCILFREDKKLFDFNQTSVDYIESG